MASFTGGASTAATSIPVSEICNAMFYTIHQYLCFDGGGFLAVPIVLTGADIENRSRASEACSDFQVLV